MNYRDIHMIKNPPGTPKDKMRCEFCHVLLTDDNRSKISNMIVTLEHGIYQLCKKCRQRFQGRVDDSTLLKRAYYIARTMSIQTPEERLKMWNEELAKLKQMHLDGVSLPGLYE